MLLCKVSAYIWSASNFNLQRLATDEYSSEFPSVCEARMYVYKTSGQCPAEHPVIQLTHLSQHNFPCHHLMSTPPYTDY